MMLNLIRRSIQKYGIINLVRIALFELFFDLYYGIDTRHFDDIEINHKTKKNAHVYQPSNIILLNAVLQNIPFALDKTYILDYGCGKGRVLCYLLKKGTANATGVEFDKSLANIADSNMKKMRFPTTKYFIAAEDAASFKIPEETNTIVLFNSFFGDTLNKVFNNIAKHAQKQPTYVFYLNQHCAPPENFRKIKSLGFNNYLYRID